MNDPDDLTTMVLATIKRHRMLARDETVLVAVSGGPDSTVLLHLLAGWREELGVALVAAHLNHSFRGAEADGDADYVAGLCRDLGIACVIEKVDVPAAQRRLRLSAQEAARQIRHAFLRRVADEGGATCIALGHTRDDRVETILMNLLRGTGPEGLGGFPAVDPPLIRPLYDVTRAQVLDYCHAHSLNPRHDSSNASTRYTRNRMRTELLPHLRAYYNAGADKALLRMAELVTADHQVLEQMAAEFVREQAHVSVNDALLPRAALLALPLALQRRAIRHAIGALRGHLHDVAFDIIEKLTAALANDETLAVTLPCANALVIQVSVVSEGIRLLRVEPEAVALPWHRFLTIPGDTILPWAGIGIRAWLGNIDAIHNAVESLRTGTQTHPNATYGYLQEVVFRLSDVRLPLQARSWRSGDRMRLRGMTGTKKLQDLFVDARVPRTQRAQLPVICAAQGEILAVIGVRVSALALRPEEYSGNKEQKENQGNEALLLMPYPLAAEDTDTSPWYIG